MDKISVLLADDHTIFRQGLRMLLEQEDDIEVSWRGCQWKRSDRTGKKIKARYHLT